MENDEADELMKHANVRIVRNENDMVAAIQETVRYLHRRSLVSSRNIAYFYLATSSLVTGLNLAQAGFAVRADVPQAWSTWLLYGVWFVVLIGSGIMSFKLRRRIAEFDKMYSDWPEELHRGDRNGQGFG